MKKTMTLNPISRLLTTRRLWWTASLLAPGFALANPTGADVVSGQVGFSNPDANTLLIDQTTNSAAINWQSFSIDSAEFVIFNQLSSSSVVLNRVVGGNPSEIFGHLQANGRVFLINPNGVLFAPGSQVDVGGLMASTLDISPEDFAAGRYTFAGASEADVINAGTITAGPNGFVVLAADGVLNSGLIQGHLGEVVLASGSAVTLTLADSGLVSYAIDAAALSAESGVTNVGQIIADGGLVVMAAATAQSLARTVVNNEGLIRANSIAEGANGEIILTAAGGDIVNSGTLDASGVNGQNGGTVSVVGDRGTRLTSTSVINAQGDGLGALGGSVHVSGTTVSVRGVLTLGQKGRFMLDPQDLTIANGTGATASNVVYENQLESWLQSSADILLTATRSITLNDLSDNAINGGDASLTLGIGASNAGVYARGPGEPGGGITFLDGNDAIIVGRRLQLTAGSVAGNGGINNLGTLQAGGDILLEAADPITGRNINLVAGGGVTVDADIFADGESGSARVNIFAGSGDVNVFGDITVVGTGEGFLGSYGSENLQPPAAGLFINADRGNVQIGSSGAGGTADISVTATNGPAYVHLRAGSPFGSSSYGDLSVFGGITVEGGGGTGVDFFSPSFARAVDVRLEAFASSSGFSGGNVLVRDAVTLTANAVDAFGSYGSTAGPSYADVHLYGAAAAMHARGTNTVEIGSISLNAVGEGRVDLAARQSVQVGAIDIDVAEGYGHATITSPFGSSFLSNRAEDGDARGGNAELNVFGNSGSYGSITGNVSLGPVSITGPIAEMRVFGQSVTINSSGAGALNIRATGQDVRFKGSNSSEGAYNDVEFGEADVLINGFNQVQINGGVSVVGENVAPARLRINGQNAVYLGGNVDVSGYGQGFFGKPTFLNDEGSSGSSFGAAVLSVYTSNGNISVGSAEGTPGNITVTANNGLALVELEAGGGGSFGNLFVHGDITVTGGGGNGGGSYYSSSSATQLPTVADVELSANGSFGAGTVFVAGNVNVSGVSVHVQNTFGHTNSWVNSFDSNSFSYYTSAGAFDATGSRIDLSIYGGQNVDVGGVTMTNQGEASANLYGFNGVNVRGNTTMNVAAVTGASLNQSFSSSYSYYNGTDGSSNAVYVGGSDYGSAHVAGDFGHAELHVRADTFSSPVTLGPVSVTAPDAFVDISGGHVHLNGPLSVTADGTQNLTSSGTENGVPVQPGILGGDMDAHASAQINGFGSDGEGISMTANGDLAVTGLVNATGYLDIQGWRDVRISGDINVSGVGQGYSSFFGPPLDQILLELDGPAPTVFGAVPAAQLSIRSDFGDIRIGSSSEGGTANITVSGVNGAAVADLRAFNFNGSGGEIEVYGGISVAGGGGNAALDDFPLVASLELVANGDSSIGGRVYVRDALSVTGTPVSLAFTESSSYEVGAYGNYSSFGSFTGYGAQARLNVVGAQVDLGSISVQSQGIATVNVAGGDILVRGLTSVSATAGYGSGHSSFSYTSGSGFYSSYGSGNFDAGYGGAEVRFMGGRFGSPEFNTSVELNGVTVTGPYASLDIQGGQVTLNSSEGGQAINVLADGTHFINSSGTSNGNDYTSRQYGFASAHIDAVGSDSYGQSVVVNGDVNVTGLVNAPASLVVQGYTDVTLLGDVTVSGFGNDSNGSNITAFGGSEGPGAYVDIMSRYGSVTVGSDSVGGTANITVTADNGPAHLSLDAANWSGSGDVSVYGGISVTGGGGNAGNSYSYFYRAPTVASVSINAYSSSGYGGNVFVRDGITLDANATQYSASSNYYGGSSYYYSNQINGSGGRASLDIQADRNVDLGSLTVNAAGDANVYIYAYDKLTIRGATNITVTDDTGTRSGSYHSSYFNSGSPSNYSGGSYNSNYTGTYVRGAANVDLLAGNSGSSAADQASFGRITVTGPSARLNVRGGTVRFSNSGAGNAVTVNATGTSYHSTNSFTNEYGGASSGVPYSGSSFGSGSGFGYGGGARFDIYASGGSSESPAILSQGGIRVSALAPEANGVFYASGNGDVVINGNLVVEDSGSSDARATVYAYNGGGITVNGDIRIQNFSNSADLYMEASGDISVTGQIQVIASGYGDADARMISYNGDISTGAITVTASGDSADLDLYAYNGDITTGAITVTGTSGSASLSAYGDIATGPVNITGTSSYAYLYMTASTGNITISGATRVDGSYYASASLNAYQGNINTGAIDVLSGNSSAYLYLDAGNDLTTGNITVSGYSDATGSLYAGNDITTGNINILSPSSSSGYLYMNAGNDLTTGNITVTGYSDASAYLYAGGDILTGDIELTGGSNANLSVYARHDVTAGAISLDAQFADLNMTAGSEGGYGDLTVDSINITAGGGSVYGYTSAPQVAYVNLNAYSSSSYGGGNVTVNGGVTVNANPVHYSSSFGSGNGSSGYFRRWEGDGAGAYVSVSADRNIDIGSLAVDAVGDANVYLHARNNLTVRGTTQIDVSPDVGTYSGSNYSGGGAYGSEFTQNYSRGNAYLGLRAGSDCSFSSCIVNPASVADLGRITVTGPGAWVDARGGRVQFSNSGAGNAVTVTATGNTQDSFSSYTNPGSSGSFSSSSTYGFARLDVEASAPVGTNPAIRSTGGFSVSALFANGDAALDLYAASGDISVGGVTVTASSDADADLYAGGDITTGAVNVLSDSSYAYLSMVAGGDITINGSLVVAGGSYGDNASFNINAGDTIAITGGTVDLRNGSLRAPNEVTINTTGDISLEYVGVGSFETRPDIVISAGGDLRIPSVTLYGDMVSLAAGGLLTDSSGSGVERGIHAEGLGVAAGNTISLTTTYLDVGYGSAPFGADAGVATQMNRAGLTPPMSVAPNAAFSAPTVNIEAGNLTMGGDHLFLQANSLNLGTGMAIVPTNVLVHYRPYSANLPIRLYSDLSGVTPQTGALYLGDVQHFQRFPGTTHFFGGSGYGGAIQVSPDSVPITHGNSTNFVFLTFGPLSGADTIVTDGTVFPLFTVTDYQPVAGEYDPSNGGADKRKSGGGEGIYGYVDGADAGEVQQQTNADVSGECKS